MKLFFALLVILLVAGNAHAQCTADNLIALGVNNVQAVALGCDGLKGNVGITGTLTASGVTTATSGVKFSAAAFQTVAAAGSAQAHGPITAGKFIVQVTASDGTKVVTLPACAAANVGEVYFLLNTVVNQPLKIFPATGGNINGAGANTAITKANGTNSICACQAANVWYCG